MKNGIWFALVVAAFACSSPTSSPDARWISPTQEAHQSYGVFLFRNTFDLVEIPDELLINLSADNRYKFYVNEQLVAEGPARGEVDHWYYETIDLAKYLKSGQNVLAAQVTNFGENRPLAQITQQTGFWAEAVNEAYNNLNTGAGKWRVRENSAYQQIPFGPSLYGWYYVCGPGDDLDYTTYPDDWNSQTLDDADWQKPFDISPESSLWRLVPRDIPMMTNRNEPVDRIARTVGIELDSDNLQDPIVIPPNTTAAILLDNDSLTMGYPNLFFSKGQGSEIKMTYAESLFEGQKRKGDRNEVEGKDMVGYHDLIKPDGEEHRVYEPLWWRTFRYVQLDITTGDQPLVIEKLVNRFHAYPVSFDYAFASSEEAYESFLPVGERTLQLCMGETYFDCPYYEQLQYVGDTRVQALITLYLSADDQLVRKAIRQFHQTLSANGLTNSRHPAHIRQVIPGFSMYWISMLYDYLMLREDPAFVAQYLPAVDSVLDYFVPFIDEAGMLSHLDWGDTVAGGLPEYWYFTDWSGGFHRGMPQGVYDGASSVITLHYANTLLQASKMAAYFDRSEQSSQYKEQARQLMEGTIAACFDSTRGLIAQTPDKRLFAQHPNILAILTDALPLEEQKAMMHRILNDNSLIQCSMYFRFYFFEALKKLEMDDQIPALLDFWHQSLAMGLTTFPEKEGNTRSDCHGWNASPLYFFLSSYAGIESSEPGFKRLKISPQMAHMDEISAHMPHPRGMIAINLKKEEDALVGTIELPEGSSGVFEWEDQTIDLTPGDNQIAIDY